LDKEMEEKIARSFFRKNKRERVRYLLSSEKKRVKFNELLNTSLGLSINEKSIIDEIPPNLGVEDPHVLSLSKQFSSQVYCFGEYDWCGSDALGEYLPYKDVIGAFFTGGFALFAVSLNGLALFRGENFDGKLPILLLKANEDIWNSDR